MADYGWTPCNTAEILECVDPVEYAALSDAAKDGLRLILSCGTIDMHSGKNIRTWLFQIFPLGITYNNLKEKFSYTPIP